MPSDFSTLPPNPEVAEAPVKKQRTWVRDTIEVLLIALILYVIIWNALQTVRVDGMSMQNTLQNSDLLLASKISYKIGDPQRGDIVVLIPPIAPDRDFIKRVVGMPGDVLEIDGHNGASVAVIKIKPQGQGDFQTLNEPYLTVEPWIQTQSCCDSSGKATTPSPTPITIPDGQYFVMGDNRLHSEDSRFFGFVAKDKILAKAFLRIWPLGHFALGPGATLIPSATAALPLWWFGAGRPRRRRLSRRSSRR